MNFCRNLIIKNSFHNFSLEEIRIEEILCLIGEGTPPETKGKVHIEPMEAARSGGTRTRKKKEIIKPRVTTLKVIFFYFFFSTITKLILKTGSLFQKSKAKALNVKSLL